MKNPSTPQKTTTSYRWDDSNVLDLDFGNGLAFNVSWNHAKLSITDNPSDGSWVCFSDMNRSAPTSRGPFFLRAMDLQDDVAAAGVDHQKRRSHLPLRQ